MKKKLLSLVFSIFCFLGVVSLQAAEEGTQAVGNEGSKGWSPITLALWPPALGIPWDNNTYGLNLGLATYNYKDTEVVGVDLSALGSVTNNITGLQLGVGAASKNLSGVQICVGGELQKSSGLQICPIIAIAADSGTIVQVGGIAQESHNSDYAVQVGIYNRSVNSKGFQIGLMNYMDDGFLPLFPFFNFSVKETYDKSKESTSIQ